MRAAGGERADLLPVASGVRRTADGPGEASQAVGSIEHSDTALRIRDDPGQSDPRAGGQGGGEFPQEFEGSATAVNAASVAWRPLTHDAER